MSAIDQSNFEPDRNELSAALQPLLSKIEELQRSIDRLSPPVDSWVRQNELPQHLGSVGLTTLRALCRRPDAPKPNLLGLYSVAEWQLFVSNARQPAAKKSK